jgi:ketose-bisphosphate aldolase
MALISMKEMLGRARAGGYAVTYCESWNLESLQAVVEAAEEERSPFIAGFNGGFLGHSGRSKPEDLRYYTCFAAALQKCSVPVAFLLNESDDFAQIEQGIELGFNSVMVENDRLKLDAYRDLAKRVVKLAHSRGVSVEAQVGHLPNPTGHSDGEATDPAAARSFVEETGIDAVGVAVGNVHILTRGQSPIDEDALGKIRDAVRIPLVLHGGTGIPLKLAPSIIRLGVAKINYGTTLKQAFLEAVRTKLGAYHVPMSPHPFLGMGGPEDILVAGREAVKSKARELIRAFGGSGKAI